MSTLPMQDRSNSEKNMNGKTATVGGCELQLRAGLSLFKAVVLLAFIFFRHCIFDLAFQVNYLESVDDKVSEENLSEHGSLYQDVDQCNAFSCHVPLSEQYFNQKSIEYQ